MQKYDVDEDGKRLKPWVADVEIRKEKPVKFFHAHYFGQENVPTPVDAFVRAGKVLEIDAMTDLGIGLMEQFVRKSGRGSKVRAATIAIQGDKMGVALCSVKDQFNRERGRRIAYGRMKDGQFLIEEGVISGSMSKEEDGDLEV